MLGRVIRATLIPTNESTEGRAVYDRTAALLAHHLQFKLHAAPHAPQIYAHHAVIIIARRICRLRQHVLDACVVVRRVQPSKLGDRLLHHGFYLRVIRNVARNGEGLVTFLRQVLRSRLHFLLVPIRQHHGGFCFCKSLGGS